MLAIQSNTNLTLQYQISTTSDYKDIEIRKIKKDRKSIGSDNFFDTYMVRKIVSI